MKIGYHNPSTTTKYFKVFNNKTVLNWIDSSYKNDVCDSLHCDILLTDKEHKYINIFLPNSDKEDLNNEKFNSFLLSDEDQNILFETKDINEMIKYINDNYKNK